MFTYLFRLISEQLIYADIIAVYKPKHMTGGIETVAVVFNKHMHIYICIFAYCVDKLYLYFLLAVFPLTSAILRTDTQNRISVTL